MRVGKRIIHRVASAGRSKGVVKIISDWALEQNPNLKIDTHHDNIVMQKALEKNGFSRCDIILRIWAIVTSDAGAKTFRFSNVCDFYKSLFWKQ